MAKCYVLIQLPWHVQSAGFQRIPEVKNRVALFALN